jgi:hypothetical protein
LRNFIIRIISLLKAFFFLLNPGSYLGFLSNPLIFSGNALKLSKWISVQRKKKLPVDDFFKLIRNYDDRFQLHDYIVKSENLENLPVYYMEFGVAEGTSFKWWLDNTKNPDSRYYGFDTFEGLPEDWGIFKKGEMGPDTSQFKDTRHKFIKGLFSDTLPDFLKTTEFNPAYKKVFHMDADLFSSTLYALTSISNLLKPGDIIMFDEFCVPNHEFFAFSMFVESYNIKYETLGAVNNYLQVAVKII